MKKVILLFLIAATIVSCNKNETTTPAEKSEAELAFNVTTIFPDANREWEYDVPECDPTAVAVTAKFKLAEIEGPDDGYFNVDVFYTNDSLYTQVLKVNLTECDDDGDGCCTFTLTEFYLLDANGVEIKAMPAVDSEFFEFVTNPEELTFEVCAFKKTQVYVDVLCFEEHLYELFGFYWFNITEITVREMCFFGDICISYFDNPFTDWQEIDNLYQGQTNGIQADMPAIFTLMVYTWDDDANDWTANPREWNNEYYADGSPWLGENDPLCIRYADYDNAIDQYKVEVYVYGPYGPFGYPAQPTGVWYFTDNAQSLDLNQDGVVDFVLGDCNEDPEYEFPESAPGK
ncbi:MAG: hypothetical protein KQH67_04760 [Bacteroidetes bacterium]|nr:hypothetical protein [Bacteroidota bacterium]